MTTATAAGEAAQDTADAADDLAAALLLALYDAGLAAPAGDAVDAATAAAGAAVSLPRLVKQLGLGASVLLRAAAPLGETTPGGRPGPGWVRVSSGDGRWTLALTAHGRACVAAARGA